MSALDGWIDICRAGTWRDMAGRAVTLDEDRLDRIVAAHAEADPAPVVVGHPQADAPAYAWIDGLRRVGDRLQARLRDIAPAFREAVEAGRYGGRSVALDGDRLRHLGFLGGRAPAVPGLAPTRFAGEPEAVVAFAHESPGNIVDDGAGTADPATPPHPDPLRAQGPTGDEDGASLVPLSAPAGRRGNRGDADDAGDAGEVDDGAAGQAMDDTRLAPALSAPAGGEGTPEADDAALLAERETAIAAREARLAAREAALVEDERRHRAEAVLAPHVDAGRVLPAEQAGLAALLAVLGDAESAGGDGTTIVFASPRGDQMRMTPAAALERFLAGLPRRVEYRELAPAQAPGAPGSPGQAGEDSERIAAEARALMAAEAERGVTLTPAEAVDRARANRGLGIGGGS